MNTKECNERGKQSCNNLQANIDLLHSTNIQNFARGYKEKKSILKYLKKVQAQSQDYVGEYLRYFVLNLMSCALAFTSKKRDKNNVSNQSEK